MNRAFTILLVEDNPADARLTVEALRAANAHNQIEICEDGEAALARLRDPAPPRPDLVLLDLNLPGLDGREVLREIKADPALRALPVCILTTSRAAADVAHAYAHHTNCYIVKPVSLTDFRRVIEQIEAFWFTVVQLPDPGARAAP